jgi:23S rRNA (cytidine1920-2'-O)/16S rRNA (cytidine1409-2'-O)-methyltransferase
VSRKRADLVLVARGLFPTRAKAQAAIAAGLVSVAGRPVERASDLVEADADILAAAPHPWVSRGGVKLAHALDAFAVDPAGRVCLDLGASTGGFTDVLLARGAAQIIAVDVGTGQLDAKLRADPRVLAWEKTDARSLLPVDFAEPPSLLVADLSFISLGKAIGPALACCAPEADAVLLVKPQFEVGRAKVGKGGLVAPQDAEAAFREVAAALEAEHGLAVLASTESPVRGGDGNREWLLHARRARQPSISSVPAIVMPKPSSPT